MERSLTRVSAILSALSLVVANFVAFVTTFPASMTRAGIFEGLKRVNHTSSYGNMELAAE